MKQKIAKHKYYLILAVVLFPLFFINITPTHNWGDDYSLYIHQAKNIVEGDCPQDVKLLYNEQNPIMISSVGIGFSLLLAPLYSIFGINIKIFLYLITVFLILASIIIFQFSKKYAHPLVAILFIILIFYNKWTLQFKQNVLTEIPFMFFLYSGILIYKNNQINFWLKTIIIGVLSAYIMLLKSIGVLFLGSVIIWLMYDFSMTAIKQKVYEYKKLLSALIIGILGMSIYYVLHQWAFPSPTAGGGYISYFKSHEFFPTLLKNAELYFRLLIAFFKMYHVGRVVHIITITFLIAFFVAGVYKSFKHRFNYIDILLFSYIGILIIYPATPNNRYLIPIIPLVLLYAHEGYMLIMNKVWIERKKVVHIVLSLFLAVQMYPSIYWNIENNNRPQKGAQCPESQEVFNFIKNNFDENTRFAFRKPRVFSLYTDRPCMANNLKIREPELVLNAYQKLEIDYILFNTDELPDSAMLAFIETYVSDNQLIFQNERYKLYELR